MKKTLSKVLLRIIFFAFILPSPGRTETFLYQKCKELYDQKNYTAAIRLVDKYEDRFPKDADAARCRGLSKFNLGDKTGSIADLKKAYSYDPTDLYFLEQLMRLQYTYGYKQEMCNSWSTLKALNPIVPRDKRYDTFDENAATWDARCRK